LNVPWPAPENTQFSCPVGSTYAGLTWLQIMNLNPTTSWLALAQQYIATYLNILSGADSTPIGNSLLQATYLLSGCAPFVTAADQQAALAITAILSNYNNGVMGPPLCAASSAYYFDPCPCRCVLPDTINSGGPGVVAVEYFLTANATRVYTINLPHDNSAATTPLVTVGTVLGAVVAYVTDDTGYHLVPASGYYVPVSASGVIRVTLVGVGPENFGTVVVSDQSLPPGVMLLITDQKSLQDTQSSPSSDLLVVYIAVPLFVILILVVIVIVKLRNK